MLRKTAGFAFVLALAAFPLAASPGPGDAALVTLAIERGGERVFAPRMLVRLGEMAEARVESPAGDGHRVVLSVHRADDGFRMRSIYLARTPDGPWTVVAEPALAVGDGIPATMTLAGEGAKLRFDVEIDGGAAAELRERFLAGEAGD